MEQSQEVRGKHLHERLNDVLSSLSNLSVGYQRRLAESENRLGTYLRYRSSIHRAYVNTASIPQIENPPKVPKIRFSFSHFSMIAIRVASSYISFHKDII